MSDYIDVHHHVVPKEYADSLTKKGIDPGLPGWDVNEALETMEKNGISAAMLSLPAPGVYFRDRDPSLQFAGDFSRQMNEMSARLVRDHPKKFGAFAALPLPDADASLKELDYALDELKLDGIALFSNYDGYYLGDPKFDELFSELNRRNAVVFVHPASPPDNGGSHLGMPDSILEDCFDLTRTVFSMIVNGVTKKYQKIRFILANAGGAAPYMAARVGISSTMTAGLSGAISALADAMNFMYSLVPSWKEKMPWTLSYYIRFKNNVLPEGPDFYLKKFYYDTALSASPHALASLQTLVDSSKIVFGTGCGSDSQGIVPLTIRGIRDYPGFTEKDLTAIGRENALALFPRLK